MVCLRPSGLSAVMAMCRVGVFLPKLKVSYIDNLKSWLSLSFAYIFGICFMLEMMLVLKNNDLQRILGYDPEPLEKMRKL